MTDELDLPPRYREQLEALLRKYVPGAEVWAYGSRIRNRSHAGSDLDLVLRGPGLERLGDGYYDLLDAIEQSNIPILIQVHDWARLPESFHREIERNYVVIQSGLRPDEDNRASQQRRVSLDDVIDLRLSSVDKKSKVNEYPVRLCNYMDVYNNSFIHSDMDFMNATATEREIEKCSLVAGDVVITKDSEKHDDIGVPALVKENIPNLVCGYHLAILRPRSSEINGSYLFYALSTDETQQQFHSYANGITRFGLRKSDIGLVEIPFPPIPEQRTIAHILSTLDDKIELNRQMNETLETMARALFKSWFVDFDPVRAKMEGRDTGLSKDIAGFFPDRMVDSELGGIPEGWTAGTISDMASLNPESWKSSRPPVSVTYVDITNAKWGCIEKTETYAWEEAPSRARRVLRKNDTIVATVRPGNGSFTLIDEDGLTGSTGFAVLRPQKIYDREFVWCAATSSDNIARLAHLADGGAYPAIRPNVVLETPVVLAGHATRRIFSTITARLVDRMEDNKRESRILTSLRDTLLPKLISGEIRVSEAEQSIQAVT